MLQDPITADPSASPADTARIKHGIPNARYTLDECRATVGDHSVDHPLMTASSDRLAQALFDIVGEHHPHVASDSECPMCWASLDEGNWCRFCREAVL